MITTPSPILVSGAAGFIGFHVARRLLDDGHAVVGIDNVNDYYDPRLKEARIAQIVGQSGLTFHRVDLADTPRIMEIFEEAGPRCVINLAAHGLMPTQTSSDSSTSLRRVARSQLTIWCTRHQVRFTG
jgi:UDP-glucuronate 4-epimerase